MNLVIILALSLYTLTVIYRPVWGVYFILAFLPVYQIRFPVLGLPTTYLEWLILALAAVVAVKTLLGIGGLKKQIIIIWKQNRIILAILALFLIAGAISVLVSPVTAKALGIFKAYFVEGFIFWLLAVLLLDSEHKLTLAFKALGFLVIGLGVFGLYQFFTLYHLPPAWWGPGLEPRRVVSFYTYPNAVSLIITPIIALFTALALFRRNASQKLSGGFLGTVITFGLILMLLTFSRGAWIGYAASLLFLLLFTQYRKQILVWLAAGVILLLILPTSRARILPVITGADPAGLERFKLWRGAWEIIKRQPVLGAGLMGFREWYGTVRTAAADEILNYPHNFFLNFWVETGILGLATVLAALAWTVAQAKNLYRHFPGFRPEIIATLAALLALFVHGQLDAPFFKNDLAILFWFLLAVIPILNVQIKT